MRYLEVPGVGLASRVGLGTWQFGSREWGYGDDYAQRSAHDIVRRALELGVTFFDTAEVYAFGRSERILSEALGADRQDVVVATKRLPIAPFPPIVRGRAHASATRLRLPRIPLYQVHQPNPLVRDSVTMRGMAALLDEGRIGAVGVSNYSLDRWREADAALVVRLAARLRQQQTRLRRLEVDAAPGGVLHDGEVILVGVRAAE